MRAFPNREGLFSPSASQSGPPSDAARRRPPTLTRYRTVLLGALVCVVVVVVVVAVVDVGVVDVGVVDVGVVDVGVVVVVAVGVVSVGVCVVCVVPTGVVPLPAPPDAGPRMPPGIPATITSPATKKTTPPPMSIPWMNPPDEEPDIFLIFLACAARYCEVRKPIQLIIHQLK
jgi:hypothetical protein